MRYTIRDGTPNRNEHLFSQFNGRFNPSGNKKQPISIYDSKRKPYFPFIQYDPPPLLKIKKKKRNALEIFAKKGNNDLFGSIALQKQAVTCLWPILKRHRPELEKKEWSDKTPIWDILLWILREFDKYFPQDWNVIPAPEGVAIQIKYNYEFDYDVYWVPVCSLLKLIHVNKNLHDIIVALLGLLYSKCNMTVLDGDKYLVDRIEDVTFPELKEYDSDDNELIDRMSSYIYYYLKRGDPARYSKKIENNTVDVNDLEIIIKKFKPQNDTEQMTIDWINSGINIIKTGYSLDDFTDNKEREAPEIWQYLQFVWSDNDSVSQEREEDFNLYWESYGMINPPVFWANITKNSNETEIPERPNTPFDIMLFFERAWTVFNNFEKLELE